MKHYLNTRIVVVLLFFGFSLNCFSQSLADAARNERNRQKGATSKVVVTSTAKSTSTPTEPSSNTTTTAAASTAAVKPLQVTDNKGRDEKYWRAAFETARADLKRAEAKLQVLDLQIKDLNTRVLRESDVYNREYRLGAQITAAQKEVEDTRKEAEQAKKKLADLEDELRRSGGLPGWAR
jgi:chromosome segregation ATPase